MVGYRLLDRKRNAGPGQPPSLWTAVYITEVGYVVNRLPSTKEPAGPAHAYINGSDW